MAALVATPDPTTGTVRIDIDQTFVRDVFTRVVANGWGTPDVGPAWTVGGAAANYSVNGTQGLHVHPAVATRLESFSAVNLLDFDIQGNLPATATPTGANFFEQNITARRVDAMNFVELRLTRNVVGGIIINLRELVAGVQNTSSSFTVAGLAANANLFYRFRGCGTTLFSKIWLSGTAEPTAWTLTYQITSTFSGAVALRSVIANGITNAFPLSLPFDSLSVVVGNPIRLFRVTPDGVRTEVRGSPGFTDPMWSGSVAGDNMAVFWDNEAPLDVAVYYELTSTCVANTAITSNTVTLVSDGDGWIRDPQNPSNNIRIVMNELAFNNCDATTEVTLVSWEPRTYRNASGVFDILNASRGNSVAMRRKKYDSQITLASKSLEDVDFLENIFAPGVVLLLSLPAAYGFGRPYNSDYIAVFDVDQEPVNTDDYQDPNRQWIIPFRLNNPPADLNEGLVGGNGIGGGGATYADITASAIGATYATTTATGFTYQQLAQGVGY